MTGTLLAQMPTTVGVTMSKHEDTGLRKLLLDMPHSTFLALTALIWTLVMLLYCYGPQVSLAIWSSVISSVKVSPAGLFSMVSLNATM